VALALVGFAGAWWLTGCVPLTWAMAPGIAIAGLAAIALILLCHLQLGYAAAWMRSAAPAFWIWQKFAFVLGGLLMPLTLYPPPWGDAAALTPFASMLFAPASLAVDPRLAHFASVLGGEAVWLAVLAASTFWLGRLATSRFLERGV
jgi:ABC-2 type transport system permease protein